MHEIIKNDHRASMHGYVSYIGNLTMKMHWKIWSQGETLMYVHLENLWVDSLQRTRLPAGIFLLFLTLKTIKKIPVGKWDSYTRMLCCKWIHPLSILVIVEVKGIETL